MAIATIGYEGKTQAQMIDELKAAGVELVVDVRAVAASRRPGFSKTILGSSLEAEGIGSRHAGSAGGLFFSAAEIGGVLGPVTLGIAADLTGGFDAGLWLLTGLCCVLMVLLWRLSGLLRAPTPMQL